MLMALLSGRAGMTTDRDEEIFTDLYLTGCLTTTQIEQMHFASHRRAGNRLRELTAKGYLYYTFFDVGESLWFLTRDAFKREAEHDGAEEGRPFTPPKDRMPHQVKVNEVYVRVARILTSMFGPQTGWQWLNEGRARVGYERAGRDRAYCPDAEVRFRGHTYIIERQTEAARASREVILSRMADYADYIENVTQAKNTTEVLWACDTERDVRYAEEGGEKYGLTTYAGDVPRIARYIEGQAHRLE